MLAHVGTHNVYHIGQIVFVRKEQGSWKPEKGVTLNLIAYITTISSSPRNNRRSHIPAAVRRCRTATRVRSSPFVPTSLHHRRAES